MIAFEISVNGEPLSEPMECDGLGSLLASISFWRGSFQAGETAELIHLNRSGQATGQDTPMFSTLDLNVGDEVTIRIVNR